MSIKSRILLYFSTIFLIVGIISVYSIGTILIINSFLQDDLPRAISKIQNSSKLDIIAQLIRYDDEVLTQSARNYAFTGEQLWKDRYFEYVTKLDSNIKEALKDGDEEDKTYFSSIEEANLALVDLETKAISSADEGNLEVAQNILNSEEYAQNKATYKAGVDKYLSRRGADFNSATAVSVRAMEEVKLHLTEHMNMHLYLMIGFIIAFFFIIVFISLFILQTFMKPLGVFKAAAKEITQGNLHAKVNISKRDEIGDFAVDFNKMTDSLRESIEKIDQKVHEQTKELNEKSEHLVKQKKIVETALKEVEEEKVKYQSLLASIGDGVIATDNETKIILMNKTAERLLGWKKEEIFGKKLADVISVVDKDGKIISKELRPIEIAVKTLKPFIADTSLDYYYVGKNGKKIPVALATAPVMVNGKLIGIIDVFRDITREKEVDQMKTDFISLASHQLRTPLSAMKWFSEMLINGDAGKLNQEQLEFVNNIYQSNERMIALVNSLLNISRIESGRIIVNPQPTDLGQLINETLKELENTIKEKKLNIIISIHHDLPKINIDPKLVREVYKNLLTNSIKYTPLNGEISIFVSRKDHEIVSQISDNGYGIPKDEQDKIFDKFYRGTNVIKLETEGTGLGLYLVKAIVESSNGKIWFKSPTIIEKMPDGSTKSGGTTFWLSLPLSGSKAHTGQVTLDS